MVQRRTRSAVITDAIAAARSRTAHVPDPEDTLSLGTHKVAWGEDMDEVGMQSNRQAFADVQATGARRVGTSELPSSLVSGKYSAVPTSAFEEELDDLFGMFEDGEKASKKAGKKAGKGKRAMRESDEDITIEDRGDGSGRKRAKKRANDDPLSPMQGEVASGGLAQLSAEINALKGKLLPCDSVTLTEDNSSAKGGTRNASQDVDVQQWRDEVQFRLRLQRLLHGVARIPPLPSDGDVSVVGQTLLPTQQDLHEEIVKIAALHGAQGSAHNDDVQKLGTEVEKLYASQGLILPVFHSEYWSARCHKNRSKLVAFGSCTLMEQDENLYNDDDLYTIFALRMSVELGPQALNNLPSPSQRGPVSAPFLAGTRKHPCRDGEGDDEAVGKGMFATNESGSGARARHTKTKGRHFVPDEPIEKLKNLKPRPLHIPYASEALLRSLFR